MKRSKRAQERQQRGRRIVLWGLAAASRPNAEDVLAGQAGTGARIANLRIKVRTRWADLLVTAITAGAISPRSVTFEGVVVPGQR